MELLVALLVPFPLGYFIRNRMAAYLAYVAVHSFVFTFQSTSLVREWVGGDYSAFAKDPATAPWPYGLVNLAIYAAGLGLVALGSKVGATRRRKTVQAVDLAN
jgi:cytochrome c biogenesis factor